VAVLYGAMLTMIGVFFFGFQGSTPIDFYGKVIVDVIAVVWMVWFALALRKSPLNAGRDGT
jgi:hypothetical protein